MEELPVAVTKRVLALEGSRLTERQREVVLDAYRLNPGATERALGSAEAAGNPTAYFVSSVVRIAREEKKLAERSAAVRRRHDLDEPACNDCGDSGFVILTRDVGDTALAGEAAPCHCTLGIEKQRRYGTVHYTSEDYAPVVVDGPLISLKDYAESEAGQADPHLEAARDLWRKRNGKPPISA